MKRILSILFTITLTSCGGADSNNSNSGSNPDPRINDVMVDLNDAEELWQSNGLVDYSFGYNFKLNQACSNSSSSATDEAPALKVTVNDNEITSITAVDTGIEWQAPSGDHFGTIDEIFAYLEAELEKSPQVVAYSFSEKDQLPAFDENFGFPTRYYIEFNDASGCSSLEVAIFDFS
ncbi:DUF6174 domain-containing protein [Idiomarina seosinensis]|nr:DUF6174 domain-containing protein [Idiomarina seosinensis]